MDNFPKCFDLWKAMGNVRFTNKTLTFLGSGKLIYTYVYCITNGQIYIPELFRKVQESNLSKQEIYLKL